MKEKVIIGWIGTPTTSVYLSDIKNVLKILVEKYPIVEIRIIGGDANAVEGIPAVIKEWSLEDEISELQDFDIGIMPMPDDDWTRGKCAFKLIQYMSIGIPSVASPVGMNTEVIKEGVNGFLASTSEEWYEKLSRLIESRELRKSMGENARRVAEERFSLKNNAPLFIDILEHGCTKK